MTLTMLSHGCRRGWAMLLGAMLLVSCQGSLYYSDYQEFPDCRWDSRDTLLFDLPEPTRDMAARLSVGMRCSDAFRYRGVVVDVQQLCDGRVVWSDTLTLALYGDEDVVLGHGFPIVDRVSRPLPLRMKRGRHYTLRLTHRMRLNPLEGIPAVGVFVER